MKLNIKKKDMWHILLLIVIVSSLWSTLSITTQEELVFGDEGYYASLSQGFAENLDIRYRTVFGETDLKGEVPNTNEPMTFLMLSSFYLMLGELGMKILIPIVSIVSALLLFLLTKKIHSTRAGVIAATFYLATPAIVTHTVFVYTEHIALMFLIGSFYFLYTYLQEENFHHLVFTGILFSFSVLTEPTTILAPLIFAIVLFLYKISYKSWLKEFGTIVIIALIMMAPWMAHNYRVGSDLGFQTGRVLDPLGIDFGEETNYEDQLPDVDTGGVKDPTETGGGTANPLHKFGILNYAEFAYTLPIFFLAILGFCYYFLESKKKYIMPILWTVFFFSVVYFFLSGQRVEGLSRNTLFVAAPLAMVAGLASDKIYDYLTSFESTGKMLGIIFILVLVGWSLFTVSTKAESLRPQKQYSQSFFEACDWVKENTPEDSVLHYIYGHRSKYHCQRESVKNKHIGIEDAVTSPGNHTYEIYKTVGVDYVMLQSSLISREPRKTTYSADFVQHIMLDPHYEQVYAYPEGCNVMDMQQDCVAVYEVLDEDEMEQPEQQGNQTMTLSPEDLQGGE
ncbi:MAG: glycosyltransferase family 39 protein [Candidatus Aenigmatarchaeota archaeon]